LIWRHEIHHAAEDAASLGNDRLKIDLLLSAEIGFASRRSNLARGVAA